MGCLGLLAPLVLIEVIFRLEAWVTDGESLWTTPNVHWEVPLGWQGKEHVISKGHEDTILVLGDSFTHGLTVPSEKMWFAYLAEQLPEVNVIAYGGLGYGTLQQWLVLQKYKQEGLNPALVILQLCTNDFINNDFNLEKKSYIQRSPAPRPYLVNGKITVRYPRDYDYLLLPWVSNFQSAYKLNERLSLILSQLANKKILQSVEFVIEQKKGRYKLFKKAVDTTSKLMDRLVLEAGDATVVLVLINDIEPYTSEFISIAKAKGLPLLIPTRQNPVGQDGKLPDGAHYNVQGNQTIGRAISQIIGKKHWKEK